MNTIWFLILVTVSSNGTVTSDLQTPNSMKDNNQQLCEYWGQRLSQDLSAKVDSNTRVFWRCVSTTTDDLALAFK